MRLGQACTCPPSRIGSFHKHPPRCLTSQPFGLGFIKAGLRASRVAEDPPVDGSCGGTGGGTGGEPPSSPPRLLCLCMNRSARRWKQPFDAVEGVTRPLSSPSPLQWRKRYGAQSAGIWSSAVRSRVMRGSAGQPISVPPLALPSPIPPRVRPLSTDRNFSSPPLTPLSALCRCRSCPVGREPALFPTPPHSAFLIFSTSGRCAPSHPNQPGRAQGLRRDPCTAATEPPCEGSGPALDTDGGGCLTVGWRLPVTTLSVPCSVVGR